VKPKKKETKNKKCNQNNKVKRNTNLDKKEPTLARGLCDRSMLSAEEENLLETAFIVESSAGGGFATIKPCTVTTRRSQQLQSVPRKQSTNASNQQQCV
jgi:hypothetical protein